MLKFRMSVLMVVAATFPVFGCGIPSELPSTPPTSPTPTPAPAPPASPAAPAAPVDPTPPVVQQNRVISFSGTVRVTDGRVRYSFSGPTPPEGGLVWLLKYPSGTSLQNSSFYQTSADQWIGLPEGYVSPGDSIYIVLTDSSGSPGGSGVLAESVVVQVGSALDPEPPRIYAYNSLPYFPETDSYSDTPFFGGACTAGHTIEIRDVSMALKGSSVCEADGTFEDVPSGPAGHIYLVFDLVTGELGVSHMSTYGCDPAECKSDNYDVSTNGGLSASDYDPSSQTLSGSCVPGGVVSVQYDATAADIRKRGSEFACPVTGSFSRVVELSFDIAYRLVDFKSRTRSQPFSFNF